MQARATPTFTAMAEKRYTLNEVIAGLDGSDFEESDDDFEGDLDMDGDKCEEEEEAEKEDSEERREQEIEERDDDSEQVEVQQIPAYTLQPGCSASVEGVNPMDYFSLFFTDEILQHIIDQTNLYAAQYIEAHELPPHSRVRQWSKGVHDVAELHRFLAIIIIMGLVRYPQLEHHWSTQWPYSNAHFSNVS